jgi:hypothetical protein
MSISQLMDVELVLDGRHSATWDSELVVAYISKDSRPSFHTVSTIFVIYSKIAIGLREGPTLPTLVRMYLDTSSLESLWPKDTYSVEEFDPFNVNLPGNSVSARLRYLFVKIILQRGPNQWRSPDVDKMKILALKSLYAAMIGFKKDNLSLLYPSGKFGHRLDDLWLAKAQQTEGPSVRDRCCGHVFEKGETYYRCKYTL